MELAAHFSRAPAGIFPEPLKAADIAKSDVKLSRDLSSRSARCGTCALNACIYSHSVIADVEFLHVGPHDSQEHAVCESFPAPGMTTVAQPKVDDPYKEIARHTDFTQDLALFQGSDAEKQFLSIVAATLGRNPSYTAGAPTITHTSQISHHAPADQKHGIIASLKEQLGKLPGQAFSVEEHICPNIEEVRKKLLAKPAKGPAKKK